MENTSCINVVDPDWSQLHNDILVVVMDKLTVKDFFRCGAVCLPWKTVFADVIHQRKKQFSFPFLVVPPIVDESEFDSSEDELEDDSEHAEELKQEENINSAKDDQVRTLYNISTGTITDIQVNVPRYKHCRGSCFGWLITVEETQNSKYSPQIFNPFLSQELAINLPCLDSLAKLDPEFNTIENEKATYLEKAVLSANPTFSRGDFIVMALVGPYRQLAYVYPGANDWIAIEWDKWISESFDDLIYFSKAQQFYALKHDGLVLAIDIAEQHVKTRIVVPPAGPRYLPNRYLVESPCGDLLQVIHVGKKFGVFKLDQTINNWIQIHSLGDNALFLGHNSSRYVSTVDIPGCKSNCIYYTATWNCTNLPIKFPPSYNGVFNMQDGTIQPHYPLHSGVCITAPIWIDLTFPFGVESTYICSDLS